MKSKQSEAPLHRDTPVMFHSIDRDGRLIDVSNVWLEALGYRRDEVIGRKSSEFLSASSRQYAEEVVLPEFFRIGYCHDVPYQFESKDGRVVDVLLSATAELDEAGEVLHSRAVLIDVTERKRTEKALRDAEEIFARAFRASETILIITTLSDGRVVEVNESFERTLGYRRDEAVGRLCSSLRIWENCDDRDRYVQLLKEQRKVRELEVRFRSKSGEPLVVLLSGEIVELNGEKCLLSLVNDVTERKRAAEEIEVLHTDLAARALELEIANDELEAFSYTVSHDLRKPLTAISGYSQVVLEMAGESFDPQAKAFLKEIWSGAVRMNELIDTLLEFSRISHSELNREHVQLSALAAAAAEELRVSAPRRKVEIRIAEGLVDDGDANLLRVVLDNLLGNAWKYTAEREEAVIEFGATEVDGKTAYFVRDNGLGFDSASAGKLFVAFHRQAGTHNFKGFGIGLATVDRVIKRHGGRVWAEGEKGKGATFFFTVG